MRWHPTNPEHPFLEIISHVMSEESEAMALIHNALEDNNSEEDGNG